MVQSYRVMKMYDIYITIGEYEETSADKHDISLVYDSNAVHFIVGGQGYFNGEKLGAGDGFICVKNEFCSYHPDRDDPWKYVWFRIDGADAKKFISGFADSGYIFKYEPCGNFVPMCVSMLGNRGMNSREYSAAVFAVLLSFFGHYDAKEEKSLNERAKDYMRQNYYKKISVKNIADKLCISRAYLRNIFFESEGISPKAYIMHLRMHRACELLGSGKFTVSETAVSVGYDDPLQFSKIFKKHTGVSPNDYKVQNSISSSSSAKSKVQSNESDSLSS